MIRNPTILTFTAFYLPAYKAGGPVQSIANIVAHLSDDFCFRIVAGDRDSSDTHPFAGITAGEWTRVGRGHTMYLDNAGLTLGKIARIMREVPHDAVYLNSFFCPRFTILPLVAMRFGLVPRRPVIVAPRGEFSPGALGLKSAKKRIYIAAAKLLGLYRDVLWQASSSHEAEDIKAVFGVQARIHIASDLPRAVQDGLDHPPRTSGQPLRVVFLSRISPMKNLKFAIEVLAQVRVPVDFSIVGSVSDQTYWIECQHLIETLPSHVSVSYKGAVPTAEVPSVMAQNDVFFLPTLGENFGHVIIEALGAGTPALISDQTPWQDFAAAGCGWVEPLGNPGTYAAHIEALFAQTPQELNARRQAALGYARKLTEENANQEDNRTLFLSALHGDAQ
jgi:glycosyltransferase involved in cell wall biosynthesis